MTSFSQAMNASFRTAQLGLLWTETLAESAYVMNRRMQVLFGAASDPAKADLREIGRMVPEKADAFYRAFSDAGSARDPLDAAERFVQPIHKRVKANARRLRRVA